MYVIPGDTLAKKLPVHDDDPEGKLPSEKVLPGVMVIDALGLRAAKKSSV